MIYLNIFLFTNIFILFILSIYITLFYFKKCYNDYKKNLIEEIFLILINFALLYLYNIFKIPSYIFFFNINILLLLHFNKHTLAISSAIFNIIFIYYNQYLNIYFLILYLLYFLIYIFYKYKNYDKLFLTNTFTILTSIFITIVFKINIQNLIINLIYILSSYIITFYIIYFKRKIKLYTAIYDIEKDKTFKTSIFKVTHEIKNPLAVIKGYLSIFDCENIEKSKNYINILKKEVDNTLLVLKDFSELNNMKINKEYMNFNDLLSEIKITILPFFNNKRINLQIDSEKNIYIWADYNRLKQVFINILKNSCEALDINGNVNINVYQNSTKLIINIKDNGHGMSKETLDNLFTPFYSKKSYGTGLGLCLSKEIIENHGGNIKYTSVLNKYTNVKIILPIN